MKTSPDNSELLSISKLAFRFDLDRATISRRLAGVTPDSEKANEKLYALDRVESLLTAAEEKKNLEAVKIRKLEAEAEIKEIELSTRTGEFVARAEIVEVLQKLFGALHKKLAVQQPGKLAARLAAAKSAKAASEILRADTGEIFDDLRKDFTDFL